MRIVGKGKSDYYDSCLGYGTDPNLCYVRNPVEHEKDSQFGKRAMALKAEEGWNGKLEFDGLSGEFKLPKGYEIMYSSGLIGFCGNIIPYVRTKRLLSTSYGYQPDEIVYHYSEIEFVKYLRRYGAKLEKYKSKSKGWRWSDNLIQINVIEFFKPVKNIDFFYELGNPVWAYCNVYHKLRLERVFIENPCLKDFQFYKIYDAWQAYQELSMFLGGVLGAAHPPMLEISDKDMAKKKGFGHKYAFRKEPKNMC